MLRSNFMNGLIAIVAVAALLTGYNAFIADNKDGHLASDHIAEYLNLDVAIQEKPEAADDQVTVDEGTTTETVTVDPAPAPATTPEVEAATPAPAEAVKPTPTTPAVAAGDKAQTVYTVKEGDTYGCISERYYGSYEHWVDVANVNPSTEGYTEYELHVGAQIVLPAINAASLKPASVLCS